ncbi:MAG: retropepsin-like domain-containing protein [Planctomycetes bacterium]|nr:retropepsin-like domain-containing protein [Planctomycetota bacterium]
MLKLYLDHSESFHVIWFRRPDGTRGSLPALRLTAYCNFMRSLAPSRNASKYGITTAIIDTGAHFSVIAHDLWQHFRPGFVTPLPFDPLTPPQLRVITIAGGTFPYGLGQLTIQLEDMDRNVLPVTVIAKLTQDGGRLPIPLALGL